MNYEPVGKQTAVNGEPGYAWLDNMRAFGRMKDGRNDKDHRVSGGNPCLEQSLESYEICCLVETYPTMCDSPDDYYRTLKFAYLYAKTVTLINTHWSETNRVMLRNRRIGASMTDITWYIQQHGLENFRQLCDKGYETIQYYDSVYSDWLAIPRSIKTTSIKPSGTVSLLPGVRPGMHYPENNYFIRRVRLAKNSELISACEKAGFVVEEDRMDKSSMVVEVPVYVPGRTLDDVSMWEQVSLAAFIQEHWADNQVSCTVTFRPHEAKDIPHALNFFQYKLKGISFLPKVETGAYPQMPYEAISRERYEKLMANLKTLVFEDIGEDSVSERFCDSTACEV
jgi:adenosylcobalamin-dependent ribonucleoside-triphosphate reductase